MQAATYCPNCRTWHSAFGDHARTCPKLDKPNARKPGRKPGGKKK